MGKPSLPPPAVVNTNTAPKPTPSRLGAFLAIIGLASLVSYQLTAGSLAPTKVNEPYAPFPKADDPFRLLPCTDATLPPALDDPHHETSWAKLFDSDPSHWSWGNKRDSSPMHANDIYAGRGIYLCGYLDVPMDYLNISEMRINRLAITKYQVSGLARSDGSSPDSAGKKSSRTLVIEPGGPDGAYDTLGWDPRGVNASLPAISCFPYDADRDRWAMLTDMYREQSADPDSLLRLADAMHNATLHACWERYGDLGRFMTTALVARDVEEIRKALGEDELSGYFVSYGTGIGQTWANMFPGSVGRLILDGTEYVRDQRLRGGFGWASLDNATNAWHDGFLGECLSAGPEHCALAKPEGGKPVVLEDLELRMRSTIDSLITHPIPGYTKESGPSLVTYRGIVAAIYSGMYSAGHWPALAQMLYELELGNSTLAAKFLESKSWDLNPSKPTLSSSLPRSEELRTFVVCADAYDAPLQADGLAWYTSLWQNMTAQNWIAGNKRFDTILPCRHFTTYWPDVAEVYRGDLNHSLKHPVLLIAETYDPATPLRNGRRLLAEMGQNARLIVHHGYGHSSWWDRSNCTESIAQAYLLNGAVPDNQETDCYADEKPYRLAVAEDPVAAWEEQLALLRSWQPWLLQ